MTSLPCVPVLLTSAAFFPLMKTVAETFPSNALPQSLRSPFLAAARPSKKTSAEPVAIGFLPWPGSGQAVGSVTRAAGFAISESILSKFRSANFSPLAASSSKGCVKNNSNSFRCHPLPAFTSFGDRQKIRMKIKTSEKKHCSPSRRRDLCAIFWKSFK